MNTVTLYWVSRTDLLFYIFSLTCIKLWLIDSVRSSKSTAPESGQGGERIRQTDVSVSSRATGGRINQGNDEPSVNRHV
uniref:Uncharacterized protein n=1 Tax=Anguilla anguilla TaxID=7936 RepID=A0A0E9WJW4_ANGAN